MKTAQDIYTEYRIMPLLQTHQLRVAAVGKLICQNFKEPVNEHDVILTGLFHDMGNITKANLATFPESLEPEGVEYWKGVKSEFMRKYGEDAHAANIAIAKELQLPPDVIELIDGISFSNIDNIVKNGSFEQKIAEYADDRVGPHGILPLRERLDEARARYVNSGKTYYTKEGFERLSESAFVLEKQVFARAHITAEEIDDDTINPLVEKLRHYPVSNS
jgi:hypothetical protein